jgi:ubiquinone/menaquinone biosynthesis C-methylase UbiE
MSQEYFNRMAASWDEVAAEKDMTRLELLSRSLDIESGSTVLDIGTGTGIFVPLLLRRIGRSGRLVALDFAGEMLKRAQAKDFSGNIEYLNADITRVPLPGGIFDAAISYSSFPHFRDKPGALKEIYRLLKNGGTLCICHSSSRNAINEMHRQIPDVRDDLIPENEEMSHMLEEAGFSEIRIEDDCESYIVRARKSGLPD